MISKKASNPVVYFEIKIGAVEAGRIEMELFADVVPKTAENFRQLCTGQSSQLSYHGCHFHRVVKNFYVQGGDIVNNDGSGLTSIYGGPFEDECLTTSHDQPGLLSMVNTGRNSNGCQFFITTAPCPHLDGKNVVFGRVLDEDLVLRKVENLPVDCNKKPLVAVCVLECGEVLVDQ